MGSYTLNSNMAIDITSPINHAAATHSLDDIRRLQAALSQKSFKSSAPTANMMSSTSPTTTAQSPFSRPSTSYQTSPPSSSHGSKAGSREASTRRNRSDSMKFIDMYPYLRDSVADRPSVYQSPYLSPPSLGISEAWLPSPPQSSLSIKTTTSGVVGTTRSRSGSLAQDFLKKQSPSQRERMQGHVRTISTEKAMLQQQEAERRRFEHQERRRRRSSKLGPMSPTFMMNSPLTDTFSLRSFTSAEDFSDFGPSYNYSSILQPDLGFSNMGFSSNNDFQIGREVEMPVAKPAMMTHEKNSYRAFVRDLQAGSGMKGHSMDFQHNGDPTSPLRAEMSSAGAVMLPQMGIVNHGIQTTKDDYERMQALIADT